MKKTEEKNTGITLIGLIVTIIVLLILAGVTVMTLTGDNGLLTKAGEAKNATEQSKLEEEVQLALIEGQTDKYFNSNSNMEEKLKAIFEKSYGQGNIDVTKAGKNYKVKVKDSKTTYRVRYDGKVEKYEEMDPTEVYARLDDDGILYLRATKVDDRYKIYTDSSSIENVLNSTKDIIDIVVIEDNIAPLTAYNMFKDCIKLKKIENMEKFHTENIKYFNYFFINCINLMEVDVSKFDTSNATTMHSMFDGCKNIKYLDVSGFNTENVTDLAWMFGGCNNLQNIDVSGFNTNKATNMARMFSQCNSLKGLDVSEFNTSNVTSFTHMFIECFSLEELDVSKFDTSKATTMHSMFDGCKNIKYLDVSGFNTENVTDLAWMFGGCNNLQSIDVSGFNTIKVTNMKSMFDSCTSLKQLDLTSFNTMSVTVYAYMFRYLSLPIKLGPNWNPSITASNTGYVGTQWNT